MALYYDLPVFKDSYKLTLSLFQLTSHFPREYKFTLGQDMKWYCLALVRSIYRANKNKDKLLYLEQFLDTFEVVKLEIRLCVDLMHISRTAQADLLRSIDSIGRQITAWRNSCR